jgi:hypothetical protein
MTTAPALSQPFAAPNVRTGRARRARVTSGDELALCAARPFLVTSGGGTRL